MIFLSRGLVLWFSQQRPYGGVWWHIQATQRTPQVHTPTPRFHFSVSISLRRPVQDADEELQPFGVVTLSNRRRRAMFKSILLLVSALLFALGILPPREKAKESSSTRVYRGQQFEYVVRSFAYICCVRLLPLYSAHLF